MNILVTGCKGYIGSVLVSRLQKSGHFIYGLDIGYYDDCLLEQNREKFKYNNKDIRDLNYKDLENVEYIIHLAALSNDPLGQLNPSLTNEINYKSTINLAELSKKLGVKRFIYASSQSMYGISNTDDELDEYNSIKNPITSYAETKWRSEQYLKNLNDENFTVVCLRPSTVFGVSPRLRCDIVYNNFVACAYTTGKIEIKSDGSPWRPVVHVQDVSSAFVACVNAPSNLISGKSYNVGIKNGNYSVKNLADTASNVVPGSNVIYTGEHGKDSRSYKVSFQRILKELKDYYKPEWNLHSGGLELVDFFKKINFNEEMFRGNRCNRLSKLKFLIENGIISEELRYLKN